MKFGELTENGSLFIHNTQSLVSIGILNLFSYSLLIDLFCSLDSNLNAEVIITSANFT